MINKTYAMIYSNWLRLQNCLTLDYQCFWLVIQWYDVENRGKKNSFKKRIAKIMKKKKGNKKKK